MRALLILIPLAAVACTAPSSDDDAASSEHDLGSSYDAMMKAACLDLLGPAEPNASATLTDERARSLSGEAMLVDATMRVDYVHCSTRDYSGERPSCAHIASRERVDTNYSPMHVVEAREGYRDVMGRIDVVATKPTLVLEPRHVQFHGNDWVNYEVEASFEDLTVTMKPDTGRTLPDDLAQAGSYSGITFHGRLGDGELTLATKAEPTVMWNTVSCARVSLVATF